MSDLKLANGLHLPAESATQTFGILAQRRKGKTYTANVMAEEMVKAGIPWVALDPTGAWWGLRSSADGTKPGLPVYVFGGDHGDLPLERNAGAMIADLVIEHPGWYVLDFSHFESKAAERELATDFAERFYRRKGANKAPMHLFVDEADMFAPQQSPAGDKRMLGAFEAIVRRGGIRGIGTTLITQRAAVLNKNVLEQIDVLIALRTVGPNDRKAIAGYVDAYATPEQKELLMGSIASLELGEAWVWEPGADLFKRVKIRERRTYNSSATPKVGDKPAPVTTLAKVDLDKLRDKMAASIAAADENDPAKLRAKIRELEKSSSEPQVEMHQVEVIPAKLQNMLDNLTGVLQSVNAVCDEIIAEAAKYAPSDGQMEQRTAPAVPPGWKAEKLPPEKGSPFKPAMVGPTDSPAFFDDLQISLGAGERKVLTAIGQHPNGITRSHLTVLTGYKRSSRNTYLSRLGQQGLIRSDDTNTVFITEKGIAELGNDYDPLPTGAALRDRLMTELPAGEKAILHELIKVYPGYLTRDDISEATGYQRSSRNTYLSRMSAREIIKVKGQEVCASDTLFIK